MPSHETIHDLADRAVSDPDSLSIPDRVRLGSWVVDRQEHIAAHKQAMADAKGDAGPAAAPAVDLPKTTGLMGRLTPPAPKLPEPTVEDHVPIAEADDHETA